MYRCPWAQTELSIPYHDQEWGSPLHDDQMLFEFLILEGAQAGLSWETILRKRDRYRLVFDQFDPVCVAGYNSLKIESLMQDAGIIRNRRKIDAAIANARIFLEIQAKHGTFDQFIWSYVDGAPIQNQFKTLAELPAETEISQIISKDLRKMGMSFVGPTIMYAFMQATGMVNDHIVDCFRYHQVQK
jgi:DNA-3-methyladenine glycosylase I